MTRLSTQSLSSFRSPVLAPVAQQCVIAAGGRQLHYLEGLVRRIQVTQKLAAPRQAATVGAGFSETDSEGASADRRQPSNPPNRAERRLLNVNPAFGLLESSRARQSAGRAEQESARGCNVSLTPPTGGRGFHRASTSTTDGADHSQGHSARKVSQHLDFARFPARQAPGRQIEPSSESCWRGNPGGWQVRCLMGGWRQLLHRS